VFYAKLGPMEAETDYTLQCNSTWATA